jgi:hypothetical protein
MTLRTVWAGVAAAGVLASAPLPAQDIQALTFPYGAASGIAYLQSGGAGWSFVPTANLTVTSVGYLDLAAAGGDPYAVVTIWSGTNTVLASYTGISDPFAPAGAIVSAPIAPLSLTVGQTYTITVNASSLSDSSWYGALHDNSGQVLYNPFQLGSALTQYQAWQLTRDGTFAPLSSDAGLNQQLLWLGPTFTYQIAPTPPRLTISLSPGNAVTLTWPTNASGYALQGSALVKGTYLTLTNTPVVVGSNYSATLPRTNAASFYRLSK